MKNVFGTSLFWIVIFAGAIFYVKLFDPSLGGQVATWFASAPITVQDLSGSQAEVMSGIVNLNTSHVKMQSTLDAIAAKLGIISVSQTGDLSALTGVVISGSSLEKTLEVQPLRK